jgi:putative phosphoribosyl transferase
VFRDRQEAGERLAAALRERIEGPAVVLGIPRGGVVVAAPVAAALGAQLDVVIPRKLGAPGNPELAVGAVAPGVRVIQSRVARAVGASPAYLDQEVARQEREIERRTELYRGDRASPALEGATVIVVDDGVATGATAIAALRWARAQAASRVVFAAPVGPAEVERRLGPDCDDCIVLETPRDLYAVGAWYDRFDQVTDDEVRDTLGTA